jgi:hypothetical protein
MPSPGGLDHRHHPTDRRRLGPSRLSVLYAVRGDGGEVFHLNALSSPIVTKIHFDVALTMIADTLYTMLARRLRGFEDCGAPKLVRHFVDGKGRIEIRGSRVEVTYPRRAHNPILRNVDWDILPTRIPLLADAQLSLRFL